MFPFSQSLLGILPYQSGVVTRQISAENPTGEKGRAATWDPNPKDPYLAHSGPAVNLGRGWKVRPFIPLKAKEIVTLVDIDGPGCINEFFITSDLPKFRALVLRMYWDNEETPSVEVPMGDFFAMGHDHAPHTVNSLPIVVAPYRGLNSYWQMPFRKHARITIENEGPTDANVIAYRALYKLHEIPDNAAYFHAQWRRTLTRRDYPEHVILDGVKGSGVFVGMYIARVALSHGWWGEGEVKFFLDGDTEFPSFADNGTEDYFGGAWSFYKEFLAGVEQEFCTPYLGMPLAQTSNTQGPRRFSLYRWHLLDSIGFSSDLKVTIQALGWWPDQTYEPLTDDFATVAYWYQQEPHSLFPSLPPLSERWSR